MVHKRIKKFVVFYDKSSKVEYFDGYDEEDVVKRNPKLKKTEWSMLEKKDGK